MNGNSKVGSAILTWVLLSAPTIADYVNFEVSHVHPIDLAGDRLLAVNTPDALLEVFTVGTDGSLTPEAAIPVGLEPVSVVARSVSEAWVVNNLSDSISIVDLTIGAVTRTLDVGNEPTDVAFAGGKAFVAVSEEDAVEVFNLGNLDAAPVTVALSGRDIRALAVSGMGDKVYAVVLKSGNETAVITLSVVHFNNEPAAEAVLDQLGLRTMNCEGVPQGTPPAAYPPLPAGITRNGTLPDPPLGGPPKVALIVKWNRITDQWEDEAGTSWSHCLQFRPADDDLFIIDASSLSVTAVKHLGTSLFDVTVHPNGKIYIPHTEARNFIPSAQHVTEGSGRFEHLGGVRGRVVDNRLAIVDPGSSNSVTIVELNAHINRSVTPGPITERDASISQPGMLAWKGDGSFGYLTAIGSQKLFRVNGGCLTANCIVGPTRSTPDAIVVGEGPTGVALREDTPLPGTDRLYVLNRISHSIALVDATPSGMTQVGEVPLHDPSPDEVLAGRRFLYDAVDTSGHGDSACASCHLSGDLDGLAWELGNPEDDFVLYSKPIDNVRFIQTGGTPCDPAMDPNCAAADGFDPQKGPMTTQTLRGMLEPLHWRGDRTTMRDFNGAFVALMGTANLGTPSEPKGLADADMEKFRQFALRLSFPPNPHRKIDDTLPIGLVQAHGMLQPGDPTQGETDFNTASTDGGGSCVLCHKHPFGAAGGKLGGVEPQEPTGTDTSALFNGALDLAAPNDMEVPHLRNMHEKFGAVWAEPGPLTCGNDEPGKCDNDPARDCSTATDCSKPETKVTFGYIHDGSVPDLYHFLAAQVFTVTTQQIRDIVAFMFHFPSSIRPAVGRQVTLPSGTPPMVPTADDLLLGTLETLGDLADSGRHCELVAATVSAGRMRSYHLSGSVWVTDVAGEPPLTTTALREAAQQPLTFTCATVMSGQRLGGNRDEDVVLNGDDCAPADAQTWTEPVTVDDLVLSQPGPTRLTWGDQSGTTGPSLRFDLLGGDLSTLRTSGVDAATTCDVEGLGAATYDDLRPDPASREGNFYLVRAANPCAVAGLGTGRETLQSLACP